MFRCNLKVDCPGGTDENGCDFHCAPHGMFACKQQLTCLPLNKVCNGKNECEDGSDEMPEACAIGKDQVIAFIYIYYWYSSMSRFTLLYCYAECNVKTKAIKRGTLLQGCRYVRCSHLPVSFYITLNCQRKLFLNRKI